MFLTCRAHGVPLNPFKFVLLSCWKVWFCFSCKNEETKGTSVLKGYVYPLLSLGWTRSDYF